MERKPCRSGLGDQRPPVGPAGLLVYSYDTFQFVANKEIYYFGLVIPQGPLPLLQEHLTSFLLPFWDHNRIIGPSFGVHLVRTI